MTSCLYAPIQQALEIAENFLSLVLKEEAGVGEAEDGETSEMDWALIVSLTAENLYVQNLRVGQHFPNDYCPAQTGNLSKV